ncbi:HotDog domain-containing protein [Hygrophoropsis aurantiaca]|uniref:HotDog domain-containing protein n=1 Tax=Hygrophoropsis aurantiaca TaxID=72124 RepID=A0ACB8AI43_9AGAM|nr:HotDog domain-containing protein [Hygrophoropsis aurantiaca]
MESTSQVDDLPQVGGNASQELKLKIFGFLQQRSKDIRQLRPLMAGFEVETISRLIWREISVLNNSEESERLQGRVVFEITVDEDMLNPRGTLHGACSGLLIDHCSTMPILVLGLAAGGQGELGVSQSLNVVYHSPAMLGDKLRIVCTTLTLGNRALSSRCEIWDETSHRLVASGVHTKMAASPPKDKPVSKL